MIADEQQEIANDMIQEMIENCEQESRWLKWSSSEENDAFQRSKCE